MTFIIDNWYIIVAILAVVIIGVILAIKFFKGDLEKQLNKVREWLIYAVTLAEKELGSGTGTLKLRYVYDMFTTKFPWLVKIISFDRFSGLVDDALDEMRYILTTSDPIEEYVAGALDGSKTTNKGE